MTEGFYLQGMIFPLAKTSNQNMEFLIIKVDVGKGLLSYDNSFIMFVCGNAKIDMSTKNFCKFYWQVVAQEI